MALPHSRILIVEDDQTCRQVLHRLLQKIGYDPLVVATGGQALLLLHRETVDLILMDIMLPDIDGYAVTAEIRQIERQQQRVRVPIVAVTSLGMPEHREASFAAGADEHVTKPVSPAELLGLLQRFLPMT